MLYKLIKSKFQVTNSFCKECGRDVHDFLAPDEIWSKVEPEIKYGKVLCYDCFCQKCQELGLPSVYFLVPATKDITKIETITVRYLIERQHGGNKII